MSWYVRFLLLNADDIRERVAFGDKASGRKEKKKIIRFDQYDEYVSGWEDTGNLFDDENIYGDNNIEDNDCFNDLLLIERKIKELYEGGILTGRDVELVNNLSGDAHISSLEDALGAGRFSISDRFVLICNLIAGSLGSVFTDEGYLEHLQLDHKLTVEQVEVFRNLIITNLKL